MRTQVLLAGSTVNAQSNAGTAYLYYGKYLTAADQKPVALSDPSVGFNHHFGSSLRPLIDYNNDGRADVFVGDPDDNKAAVFVFGATPFTASPIDPDKSSGFGQ